MDISECRALHSDLDRCGYYLEVADNKTGVYGIWQSTFVLELGGRPGWDDPSTCIAVCKEEQKLGRSVSGVA